jgi:hypothetical protein
MATTTSNDHSEKEAINQHHEHGEGIEVDEVARVFDDVNQSKVLRKIDYRLLPVLSFLYLLAFLDRSNLGNAKVAGLEEDLQLTGLQYNLAATVSSYTVCLCCASEN